MRRYLIASMLMLSACGEPQQWTEAPSPEVSMRNAPPASDIAYCRQTAANAAPLPMAPPPSSPTYRVSGTYQQYGRMPDQFHATM